MVFPTGLAWEPLYARIADLLPLPLGRSPQTSHHLHPSPRWLLAGIGVMEVLRQKDGPVLPEDAEAAAAGAEAAAAVGR